MDGNSVVLRSHNYLISSSALDDAVYSQGGFWLVFGKGFGTRNRVDVAQGL